MPPEQNAFLPRLILCVGFLLCLRAAAQSDPMPMRPGLWEMTTTSGLLKQVPEIAPDQMDQLRNLARQNGFELPTLRDGAAVSMVCITPEMAKQNVPPTMIHDQSGCAAEHVARNDNAYRADLVCNGQAIQGSGQAEGSFSSPERFSGQTVFNGLVQGLPVNERAQTTGRWVAARCDQAAPAR